MAPANLPNAVNFWGHGNISAGFCYCTFCLHVLLVTHGFLVVNILGISAFYHDSAAALISDGEVIAAAQEERFTRIKHDSTFPSQSIEFCLNKAGLNSNKVDYVVFYDKPFLKFERLIENYVAFAPRGFGSFSKAMPIWLGEKLFQKSHLKKKLKNLLIEANLEEKLLFSEHHQSHAASAFFPSPFQSAAILTMDGVGEWTTTSLSLGSGSRLEMVQEIQFPHSVGLLYSAFTYYIGFKVNSGEYKVMGLAPYGEPRFRELILDQLIDLKPDGSFRLNLDYFDYCTGFTMTNDRFSDLFGGPPRDPKSPITQRDMDLASSIQSVTEEIVCRLGYSIAKETGERNICLAGGVALNCVANGRLFKEGIFDRIWVQPAAGDAGGAVGSALAAYHGYAGKPRKAKQTTDCMKGAYLGPSYDDDHIQTYLKSVGAKFSLMDQRSMIQKTAQLLASGCAVGWFQGRMEFGPRALGCRSILADPRSPSIQKTLNLKVKHRESFRPFAPSILREDLPDWFDIDVDSPYMLVVANIREEHRRNVTDQEQCLVGIDKLNVSRSSIPAVTHVDYSARIQTVHSETNPRYHELLVAFKHLTGCPILVNTSFNVRGEPIVCTPKDAFLCFMGTDIEALVIGNCVLEKQHQGASHKRDHKDLFAPD